MPTRLIFSTGSLYLLDTALVFDMAAEAGFDGMEIMCDDRFTTREPGSRGLNGVWTAKTGRPCREIGRAHV